MENSFLDLEEESGLPQAAKKWNWGAFWLTCIWGVRNGLYWTLLAVIPVVHAGLAFYLGYRGGKLAWEKGNWKSEEAFEKSQKRWNVGGWIVGIAMIAAVFFHIFVVNQAQKLNNAMVEDLYQQLAESEQIKEAIGEYYEVMPDAVVFDPTYYKGSTAADVIVALEKDGKVLALNCVYDMEKNRLQSVTLDSDTDPQLKGKRIVFAENGD